MFWGDQAHYLFVGATALSCILHSLGLGSVERVHKILDFGCGAGRVSRWLSAAFPDAMLHACDLREADLEFVRQNYHATTWVSGTDIHALNPPESYDLLWVGSVFTHLPPELSKKLFKKMMTWLTPNGVLVFSVHGRRVLQRAKAGDTIYGLGDDLEKLWINYVNTGYGYVDYRQQTGYGISVSKSNWWVGFIEEQGTVKLVCLSERAWDDHHDVIAVQNM